MLLFHTRENVIACAVEDAENLLHMVGGEAFAKGLQAGDAAADGRFEPDIDAVFLRGGEKLLSVGGKQRLVGGDDGFLVLESFENERFGDGRAADEFDDDLYIRIFNDIHGVRSQHAVRDFHAAIRRDVQIRNTCDDRREANPLADELRVFLDGFDDACADGSKTDDADVEFFHVVFSCKLNGLGDWLRDFRSVAFAVKP